MRHVEKALLKFHESLDDKEEVPFKFIAIENMADEKGVAPIVKFTIQSDPIKEVGYNGCQAVDMLTYVKCLFESLNEAFPCQENRQTLIALNGAIRWQDARTEDRENRGVEGRSEK